MTDYKGKTKSYFSKLTTLLEKLNHSEVDCAISLIDEAWRNNKQIITFGNGGSSLTAIHYITDWNKSVSIAGERPFRGRCLVDNIGLVMAYSNDVSFQDIFVEQLKNILEPGDLVLAISGSAN